MQNLRRQDLAENANNPLENFAEGMRPVNMISG
jgi:hypothetical protein